MIVIPGVIVQSKIHESSRSLVYRGIRESDDGEIAQGALPQAIVVKLLKQDYPSPQAVARCRQEYNITRLFNLDGVIKAYSQQNYQRTLVTFLEDFGGESLAHWMGQQSQTFCPMCLPAFLRLAIDLTDTLGRVHAAQVIHKDINPKNLVFNPATGVIKIIDFGIATQFSRTNPIFKSPHMLEGTLAYLSPEQTGRMNRLVDCRTDFYSLGVTFYELLTGQLPFPTTDIMELVHCHIAKSPVSPHRLNAAIPKSVSDIVLKLMAKNAEDRYQSAWGLKADLEVCAHQLTATGRIADLQLGQQDVIDQFRIPQKLYGREAEIKALLTAFDRVSGRSEEEEGKNNEKENEQTSVLSPLQIFSTASEMMLVSGYAGAGKSALVQELYKPITAKRGYFISGKFDQFQRNVPYSAIANALRKLVRQLLGEPKERVQQWRSRLIAALGNNGQIITNVIPEVELLIGKQPPAPKVGEIEDRSRFNCVFQQFIRVFCSKSHPLAIFLDDLQWVDSATLQLIEMLLLDQQTQFLFLIGAYRHNEVSPTHPLALMLEKLRRQKAAIQEIVLTPLTLEPLSQLLAETMHRQADSVHALAQLVLHKTEGNPFFVNEFLRMLYSENLLTFDTKHLSWQWDIAQIQAQAITDNVVDLLLIKLKRLPESTQKILRLAACVGAEFSLKMLTIVCEQSPEAISRQLLAAIQAGLIQPLSELDEDLLVQEYRFLHDRVQQAAYALIPEDQKQVTRYSIGQLLLSKLSEIEQSAMLFDIVNHINFGQSLLTQRDEKERIAQLNLTAARKAISSTAYENAIWYLETGIGFLEEEAWISQYDLMFNLHRSLCAAQLSSASYDRLSATAKVTLKHTVSATDRADIYVFQVTQYTLQGDCEKAVQIGLAGLRELGIEVEGSNLAELNREEFAAVAKTLENRSISSLLTLPPMSDSVIQATVKLLISLDPPAYIAANIELYTLISLRAVHLSIEYGNIAESIKAYANYGLLLGSITGQYQRGYEFADLAVQLSHKLDSKSQQCKAKLLFGAYIHVWAKPIAGAAITNYEGFLAGIASGEVQFAAYNLFCNIFNRLFQGENLTAVAEDNKNYQLVAEQIQDELLKVALAGASSFISKLTLGEDIQERRKSFMELEKIVYQGETSQMRLSLCLYYILKMHLSCLTADFEQGFHYLTEAGKILNSVVGFTTYSGYFYYGSLILLNLYFGLSQVEQSNALEQVRLNQERLKTWSDNCSENFLHKFYLVEAEKARVLGQVLEAEEFYEQAISGASENNFIQEEALAYELAAKFYLGRGRKKFAKTYLKEAHYCYERWGATAKAKDLETCYPQFSLRSSPVAYTAVRSASDDTFHSDSAFDLEAVMRSSQAISREIEMEQVLCSLMQILVENAGAQAGSLILESSGEWAIEATYELNDSEKGFAARVLQSIPTVNCLPEAIIQSVIRTHESVILNNAAHEGNFIHEPYIQHHQTQSVFCLPLLNQNKLVGVLYLENQLAAGVFTSERAQVLNLLSTQAAIAIKNAKLYSELRASESQMRQFLEAVPIGIGIVDAAGRPYYANQQAVQLLGKGVDPAVTSEQLAKVYQFYVRGTGQTYPTEKLPIIRALSGESSRIDDVEIRQNDVTTPVEASGTPVFDEQGNVIYAIVAFQNISQRIQAESMAQGQQAALQNTLAYLATEPELDKFLGQVLATVAEQFHASLADIWLSDVEREVTNLHLRRWNPQIVPNPPNTTPSISIPFSVIQQNECWESLHLRHQPFVYLDLLSHPDSEVFQVWASVPDDVRTTLLAPLVFGGELLGVFVISHLQIHPYPPEALDLVAALAQQVVLALQLTHLAEDAKQVAIMEEHNRIAREIHDTLAQTFTGISLQLNNAQYYATQDAAIAWEIVEQVKTLARTGLAEARRSVWSLHPDADEYRDLAGSLQRSLDQLTQHTSVKANLAILGTIQLVPPDIGMNLLRIAQEATTNVLRHAQAQTLQLELAFEVDAIELRIKDDGKGFPSTSAQDYGGFGLLGMQQRCARLGGQFTLHSQPGQGTCILVQIPITSPPL